MRNLVALAMLVVMLCALVPAFAEDRVTFSTATFDMPPTLESSDEFSREGAPYYDVRWAYVLDMFNAKVEYYAYSYSTAQEQFRQMVNGGTLPDTMVCMLGSAEPRAYAEEGMIGLLPEGFEENYPNIKAMLDMIPIRDNFKLDGQYFSIPRGLETTEPFTDYDQVIFYRKDLAKAAGVEIKDVYTIDELYDMFAAVQAENPNMVMYSDIWPEDIRNIGLSEASPHFLYGKEWYKNEEGQYIYAWTQPEALDGIQTFKRFYDAGFLRKEFFSDAAYEARDQFSANQVFAYWDGLGMDFYNNVLNRYVSANPGAVVEDIIGCAWISVLDGRLLGVQGGNTWSELYFSPEIVKDEEKLHLILSMYDYLHSSEGVRLQMYGLEGIHFELDDAGNVIDIREKNPETGVPTPFNADHSIPDFIVVVMSGAFADSSVLAANPAISQYAKDEYRRLMDLRKDPANLLVLPFDNDIASFDGDLFRTAGDGLKPVNAIYKIIFENSAEDVPAAWAAWLSENQSIIDQVAAEVNAALAD